MYEWFLNIRLCCLNDANAFYKAPTCVKISIYSSLHTDNFTQTLDLAPEGAAREDYSWIPALLLNIIRNPLRDFQLEGRKQFPDLTTWGEGETLLSVTWDCPSAACWGLIFLVPPTTTARLVPCQDNLSSLQPRRCPAPIAKGFQEVPFWPTTGCCSYPRAFKVDLFIRSKPRLPDGPCGHSV